MSLSGNEIPTKWHGNEIPTNRLWELYTIYNPAARLSVTLPNLGFAQVAGL